MYITLSAACSLVLATVGVSTERMEPWKLIPVAQKISPTATHLPKNTTIPVPAVIGLKCGDTIYTISTPHGGVCSGTKTSKTCTNGKNSASASCASGCKKTKGNGTCFIADPQ